MSMMLNLRGPTQILRTPGRVDQPHMPARPGSKLGGARLVANRLGPG